MGVNPAEATNDNVGGQAHPDRTMSEQSEDKMWKKQRRESREDSTRNLENYATQFVRLENKVYNINIGHRLT